MCNKILRGLRSACYKLMTLIIDLLAEEIIDPKKLRTYFQRNTAHYALSN